MTLAQMIIETRHLIDEYGLEWLVDTSNLTFSLTKALQRGYERYAMETKCFRVERAASTIANQAIYSFACFGAEAADTDLLSVAAAADNTTAFTLVAGVPVSTYTDGHYISVSIINPTGGAITGKASTYTVVGTLPGGTPHSEAISFTLLDLTAMAGSAVVTHTTTRRFATVTSITPSIAQTASLQHSAGVGAQTPGTRLFDLTGVIYDTAATEPTPLNPINEGRLVSTWRSATAGTPEGYLRWGDRGIRLVPAPNAAKILALEGYELPDLTAFAASADEPDVSMDDHELIVIWAAILLTVRDPSDANAARQSILYPRWEAGIAAARGRIHGHGSFQIGRLAGLNSRARYQTDSTIVMAP